MAGKCRMCKQLTVTNKGQAYKDHCYYTHCWNCGRQEMRDEVTHQVVTTREGSSRTYYPRSQYGDFITIGEDGSFYTQEDVDIASGTIERRYRLSEIERNLQLQARDDDPA